MIHKRPARSVAILALLAALIGAILIAVSLGTVTMPLRNVAGILWSRLANPAALARWPETDVAIIWQLRLPRVLTAALVGAALSAAGVVFQGLLRNPMADPYIIGTSGGAALGATLALLLPAGWVWLGFTPVPVFAFVGAISAVLFVYNIARVGPKTPITTLLLSGFAFSSLASAAMSFLMTVSGNTMRRIVLWMMGGISATGWQPLAVVTPLVVLGIVLAYALSTELNAFLLGEEQAAHLGVHVERRKIGLLALGALLTGAAVSVSGLVGFVGLVVPHLSRLIFGPDHHTLLPAATLSGGIFLVLADLLARILIAPSEIPVGVVTALLGAPFLIYLLRRSKKEYTF